MKICIFSDVHGNEHAFNAAFGGILSERADINVFLGDLCGYYYGQMAIFSRLQEIPNLVSLKGNHDYLFLAIYNGDRNIRRNYVQRYGKSIEKLLQSDCHELAIWLSGLPESISWREIGVYGCHGSPWALTDGYIYPDTPLDRFEAFASSVFLLGNTHYPMHRVLGNKKIINPGSLGQPRHGGWPSYAVLDLPAGTLVYREIRYDVAPLCRQIEEAQETNRYLKDVLCRTK